MNVIAIVLINYYGEHELSLFVRTYLLEQENADLRVVIVDNGSEDRGVLAALEGPAVTVLFPGKNLGYFGGAFHAFESYMSKHNSIPDIFIISNYDLEFDKKSFLGRVSAACDESAASVLGPSIRSSLNGAELNPIYRNRFSLSHLKRILIVTSAYSVYYVYQRLHYMKRRFRGRNPHTTFERQNVYAVHGSFMIFRRSFFDRGGTLKYGSFLYGEEIFVAEQCLLLGLNTEVVPELQMVHHEHVTTGEIKDAKHMKWLHESMKFLKQRFYDA